MYLPKFKYKKPKYTQGLEFLLPNGKRYAGWYFETFKQEYFTGKEPGNTNLRLSRIPDDIPLIRTPKIFTPQKITPDQSDYSRGFYIRYFLQDKRNKRVIEVTKDKYIEYRDLIYIETLQIYWKLKGPAQSLTWYGYHYEGAASINQKAVEEASKKFPYIKDIIKTYDEFVE